MLVREIEIDGKKVRFASSARTPRLYRSIFQRDIISDFKKLQEAFKKAKTTEKQLSVMDLSVFENIAYAMCKQANPEIPSIDDWLDDFNTFDIYAIFPVIVEIWSENNKTIVDAKKK